MPLRYIKFLQEPKLVFRGKLSFLSKQLLPADRLSCLFFKKGKLKSLKKQIRYSYTLFLYSFLNNKESTYSLFYFSLEKNPMYHLLDYSLILWGQNYVSMFRLEKVKVKKTFKAWMRYVKPLRRFLLLWRWLSYLLKSFQLNNKQLLLSLSLLWNEFFLAPLKSSLLTHIKLRTYKVYLYKL